MRHVFAYLLVLWLAACPGETPPPRAPATHPDSPLALIEASFDMDGATVGRSPAKATVVVVFASWCEHCKSELEIVAQVRANHGHTRVLGVNYRGHEEYDRRGNAAAVRDYVATNVPWLRVVPAEEPLFAALGRPPKVPTIFVYDSFGNLVARYDRQERKMPDAEELDALLTRMGG